MQVEVWLKLDVEKLTVSLAVLRSKDGQVMVDQSVLAALYNGGPSHLADPNESWYITEQLAAELLTSQGYRKWEIE